MRLGFYAMTKDKTSFHFFRAILMVLRSSDAKKLAEEKSHNSEELLKFLWTLIPRTKFETFIDI